ncbi:Variant-specific surface protein [Giardia duodenalis assemblage B]|uniref:Variant-specific surface protein n=1 Tax=Giardia duodenalis assemblage B TaxID=1394984 RepID=A0A132NM00_GIAIN|nr:Variant-specific surface protein [Giardia intestinalis assemblage B]
MNDQSACAQCDTSCATCSGAGQNACTSCPEGKYLKGNTCAENCGDNTYYPDPVSRKCISCSAATNEGGIEGCTACTYNATVSKPQCTNCGSKKVKYMIDGSTVCIDLASGCVDTDHFKADNDAGCVLCSDINGSDETTNKGVAQCKACTKTASQKPECTDCLEGYIKEGSGVAATCQACGTGCVTCAKKTENTQCQTCKSGFFLKGAAPGQYIACGDTAQGGIDGCAECSGTTGSLKCTKCKVNYNPSGEETNLTCTKVCEDDSACGGTAGSCDAIVIGASGEMTYYCSLCGQSNYVPIDGKCVDKASNTNGNICDQGVCTSCTTGYFLYMGGCYKVDTTPGSLMCSKATTAGVCDTPSANSRYFKVPGATDKQQSVLACGNPLGTNTTESNAYVGIQGCKTCEAPTAATGMAAAKCTACDGGKVLTSSGYGCVTCDIAGCSACRADNMCEACGDGYRLEGDTCVSTGGGSNLSSGAIAGISIAVITVVGGLVGFLYWWFICRGKA